MSLEFYRVLHLLGVITLFFSLGGLTLHAMTAGDAEEHKGARKLLMALHGVALLILLVAGFGALAKLKLGGMPPWWVWVKLGVWLVLGGAPMLVKRKPNVGKALCFVLPLLGLGAAALGILGPPSP